ncbi:hypothetical protein [Prevotella sp. AGR2160]|uniref:hypothetical protein n=1 Tax=Prevotella sp. AGR2160 TaxID=1280674 RepID=UPI0012DD2F45|nr:hypothetical protein [Prevotella sp. AGR2160]
MAFEVFQFSWRGRNRTTPTNWMKDAPAWFLSCFFWFSSNNKKTTIKQKYFSSVLLLYFTFIVGGKPDKKSFWDPLKSLRSLEQRE